MDVELPDGRVVQGVPDGMGQLQVADKLRRNGINVPDEWLKTGAPPKASLSAPNQFTEAGRSQADAEWTKQKEKDIGQMKEFGQHAASSAVDTAKGLLNIAVHPIETAKRVPELVSRGAEDVAHAVAHPMETVQKGADYLRNLTPGKVGDIAGGLAVG